VVERAAGHSVRLEKDHPVLNSILGGLLLSDRAELQAEGGTGQKDALLQNAASPHCLQQETG